MVAMRTVKIGALKAKLSAHIQYVKNGEEVIVCERNTPVARIVPIRLQDEDERMKRLIARGILTPPHKKRDPKAKLPKPTGKTIPDKVMDEVWRQVRGDW
jgi:prevent-host-death family protein